MRPMLCVTCLLAVSVAAEADMFGAGFPEWASRPLGLEFADQPVESVLQTVTDRTGAVCIVAGRRALDVIDTTYSKPGEQDSALGWLSGIAQTSGLHLQVSDQAAVLLDLSDSPFSRPQHDGSLGREERLAGGLLALLGQAPPEAALRLCVTGGALEDELSKCRLSSLEPMGLFIGAPKSASSDRVFWVWPVPEIYVMQSLDFWAKGRRLDASRSLAALAVESARPFIRCQFGRIDQAAGRLTDVEWEAVGFPLTQDQAEAVAESVRVFQNEWAEIRHRLASLIPIALDGDTNVADVVQALSRGALVEPNGFGAVKLWTTRATTTGAVVAECLAYATGARLVLYGDEGVAMEPAQGWHMPAPMQLALRFRAEAEGAPHYIRLAAYALDHPEPGTLVAFPEWVQELVRSHAATLEPPPSITSDTPLRLGVQWRMSAYEPILAHDPDDTDPWRVQIRHPGSLGHDTLAFPWSAPDPFGFMLPSLGSTGR